MNELGSRRRSQPAPPSVIWEALTQPRRLGGRPWLYLFDDEADPTVIEAHRPSRVVWSSLWPARPGDRIIFDIDIDAPGSGSLLRWTLLTEDTAVPQAVVGHLRHRLNHLINADLRFSFDQ